MSVGVAYRLYTVRIADDSGSAAAEGVQLDEAVLPPPLSPVDAVSAQASVFPSATAGSEVLGDAQRGTLT